MRKSPTIALAAAIFALAGAANAQNYGAPFGSKGQMTFGAERLFGFSWTTNHWSHPGPNNTTVSGDFSGTTVGFGWAFAQPMQFNHPRAGFDYFITNSLSLGGSLGFFAANGSNDGALNANGVIINPRIGYAIPLTPAIAFWPRGGLQYMSVGDTHVLGLSGEANFVFLPRPDWGFLLSPTLDLAPFGGAPNDTSFSSYSFGVSVGLLGIL